ncbi:MmgE/PrpD family protein [Sediminivirga luteola]|uniref:MmgE/PrpD N-terminal domain-containing protein n=1 Tax=Sediminivirga luteola TaxID=1774748 RepID=A0A8J2XLZ3_9MICO|nr:MmgE/PrpD family protein [Sediminivirga luteola]MCI2265140.1 MmgE/PrpD family protein [Sediminivirga luteola]GGA22071.1 hypothetical protein GCM10011333_26400 [Sediminivirga luteola]
MASPTVPAAAPLTDRFAAFSDDLENLPAGIMTTAARIFRHNLLVALAARPMRVPGACDEPWPEGLPRQARARRLSDCEVVPAERAVLSNALLMGARAQHDEVPGAISHFGSTVIPPLLAAAEQRTTSGTEFLTALVIGYEIAERLGRATVDHVRSRGFRPTGIFGPIAGAAAASRIRSLRGSEFASALALAANMSAGLSETWRSGTDEWTYQTALAARSAHTAAELAARGVQGSRNTFEAPHGFIRAFAGAQDLSLSMEDLGSRWATADVVLKLYPVCVFNQAVVQQVVWLRDRLAGPVESIEIKMHPRDAEYPGVDNPNPAPRQASALMSAQLCAAIAAVNGTVDVPSLSAPPTDEVQHLARTTTLVRDTAVPSHGAAVTLKSADGVHHVAPPSIATMDETTLRHSYEALYPLMGISMSQFSTLLDLPDDLASYRDILDVYRVVAPTASRAHEEGAGR